MFEFTKTNDGLTIEFTTPVLDAASAEAFEKALGTQSLHHGSVTVDLSQVRKIDSGGIGALLALHNRVGEDRRPIILRGPKPEVVSVIELLRLHRVFVIEL